MRDRPVLLLVFGLMAAGLVGASDSALAAERIDLVIDEPFADRSAAWPITTGVPFPRGKLTSAEHCRLIDDQGKEQLLQARVAATWDSERTSVRWLTIDFIAEPGRKYALEFGNDVVRQPQFPLRLLCSMGHPCRISTGPLRAEFSSSGPRALAAIEVDLDGDGFFAGNKLAVRRAGCDE